jgi:hypothetical protein
VSPADLSQERPHHLVSLRRCRRDRRFQSFDRFADGISASGSELRTRGRERACPLDYRTCGIPSGRRKVGALNVVADRPVVTFSTGPIREARPFTAFEPEPESATISSCKIGRPAHYAQLRDPPRASPPVSLAEDRADQRFALSQSTIRSCASSTQQPQLPVTQ